MNKRAVHLDELPRNHSDKLMDNYGRHISYLRMAITDRCNLRCQYCMPAEGVPFDGHDAILSYEEILRLLQIAASLGITKIRFTGGEPFARKDFIHLFEKTAAIPGIEEIHITSNGVSLAEHVNTLKDLGVSGINLSLDTLDPEKFLAITRRDYFSHVMNSIESVLAASIPLKINSVIQDGVNTDEIVDLARLAENKPVTVRFIEQMPFNGVDRRLGLFGMDRGFSMNCKRPGPLSIELHITREQQSCLLLLILWECLALLTPIPGNFAQPVIKFVLHRPGC